MITLILGRKGSGKTKRLMDMCNQAVEQSKGNVVFIEKDNTLTYSINHKARLVAADEYAISGFDSFYGFIAGMCAGNYDVTDIFVDSTLKIGGDVDGLLGFVEKLNAVCKKANIRVVMSVSAAQDEIPAKIAELAEEI
ncbi:MAG: ATP-binding protein [Clostridia bacterium]|nr:ATP-binding protein [Clostridia bacterium]